VNLIFGIMKLNSWAYCVQMHVIKQLAFYGLNYNTCLSSQPCWVRDLPAADFLLFCVSFCFMLQDNLL